MPIIFVGRGVFGGGAVSSLVSLSSRRDKEIITRGHRKQIRSADVVLKWRVFWVNFYGTIPPEKINTVLVDTRYEPGTKEKPRF